MVGLGSYFRKKTTIEVPPVFLIVGLGNPGREYRDTRHNIGFLVLDRLAARLDCRFSRLQSKALVVKVTFQEHHLVLAKPQTFMNLSGQAISGLVNFYKVPLSQLVVVYDDVDLSFGTLRIRPAGGSGGHNGMNSIIEKLKTSEFPRLRMGIGRPPGRMDAADYVLQSFSKNESEELKIFLDRSAEAVLTIISEGLQASMNKFNSPE